MRAYFYRKEVEDFIKGDFNYLIKYLNKKGVLTVEQLSKKYERCKKAHIKAGMNNKFLNDKMRALYDSLNLALEICEMLNLKDTSTISKDMLNDKFVDEIIEFRKNSEIARNEAVEKAGTGYKSFLYQKLDEPYGLEK
ncbi:MAG: hypothetical protein E7376_02655 [Clostridiales bacterium]|nr:hypothetical protein [Clostridiales bacterium]